MVDNAQKPAFFWLAFASTLMFCAELTHCCAFASKVPVVTHEIHRKDELEGAKQLFLVVYYSFAAPLLSFCDLSTEQHTN